LAPPLLRQSLTLYPRPPHCGGLFVIHSTQADSLILDGISLTCAPDRAIPFVSKGFARPA